MPIPAIRVAPYGIIGGGAQYGNQPRMMIPGRKAGSGNFFNLAGQGFGQLGGGMEFRLMNRAGVFADLRWLYSRVDGLPSNQMQFRYGIRMSF